MNKKLKLACILSITTIFIVGCGVSKEEQAMIDNYPKLEKKVEELQSKLDEAEPWFELKDEEKTEKTKEADTIKAEKQRKLTEGTTVFSDDRVKINYKGASNSGVEFFVENKTDATITIQGDSVALNGMSSNDIIMSDNVSPQSKGIVKVKCDLSGLGLDFKNIDTVSGGLKVIDFNKSFSTYKVTFSNVELTK